MSQSKTKSLIESCTNAVVGVALTTVAWKVIVEPVWGLAMPLNDIIGVNVLFTAISVGKAYCIRRVFNAAA